MLYKANQFATFVLATHLYRQQQNRNCVIAAFLPEARRASEAAHSGARSAHYNTHREDFMNRKFVVRLARLCFRYRLFRFLFRRVRAGHTKNFERVRRILLRSRESVPLPASMDLTCTVAAHQFAYNANHWLSGVADFGAITATTSSALELTARFPLIFSARGISYHRDSRIRPFGQVLFASRILGGSNGLRVLHFK